MAGIAGGILQARTGYGCKVSSEESRRKVKAKCVNCRLFKEIRDSLTCAI